MLHNTADPTTGVAARVDEGVRDLAAVAVRPSVETALAAVRDLLGMELTYVARIVADRQVLTRVHGDASSFGLQEGAELPLAQTYCQRILVGRLPSLMVDVRADDRAASLPITASADVGAFASVPLRRRDGTLYGTLCAGSHEARRGLGYRELQFMHVFARMVVDQIELQELQLRSAARRQRETAVEALLSALTARDGYTGDHSHAVVSLAEAVARRLRMSADDLEVVRQSALLHDIGKLAIPDAILEKPGPLTTEEWQVMRTHPISSQRIVEEIAGLAHLGPVLRAEHERWDGTGYPDGLSGEQIPLASRIVFVCDAYDAMTTDRPYRRALVEAAALQEIAAGAGTQFCPTAAGALLEVAGDQGRA